MATGEAEAAQRNDRLVEHLRSTGAVHDPAVADAFRAVLRHHFLPGLPLDEVYEDAAITVKTGELGATISSSSQPGIMAVMLEQLRLETGLRVLEVGAGTGYNAAVIAWLVRPDGHVMSLDIDEDLCARARAGLASAGTGGAEVVCADGAEGWPSGAPYDRIIVTAGARDLSPAWRDQLREGGRLVLPLELAGPVQLCVAFVRRGPALAGSELTCCGFLPLRGEMAAAGGQPDLEAAWLSGDGRPSGHAVPAADLRAGFEAWLALTHNDAVRARPLADRAPAFGLRDPHGAALLMVDGEHGRVAVFGEGDSAARRLAAAHQAWSVERPPLERLRVAAYPAGGEPRLLDGLRIIRRPSFTFVVGQR